MGIVRREEIIRPSETCFSFLFYRYKGFALEKLDEGLGRGGWEGGNVGSESDTNC